MMQVREAVAGDAGMLLALQETPAVETAFLDHEAGERLTTAEVYAQRMAVGIEGGWVMFVAEDAGAAIGCCWGQLGHVRRPRHVMHVGLGVVQAAWGRGIGRALLAAAEGWGRERGAARLELFVQASNPRALMLYERAGFALEGIKRDARRIDGSYVDECAMAKLIGDLA